jgi:hypothetical protein
MAFLSALTFAYLTVAHVSNAQRFRPIAVSSDPHLQNVPIEWAAQAQGWSKYVVLWDGG